MKNINLQEKTAALAGEIELYWFENEHIGLERTLFHRLTIPLKPFDSGLDYESQPLETEIVFEWYKLDLLDPGKLDGLNLSHERYEDAEASVYIGCAHNWCHVLNLKVSVAAEGLFEVQGDLLIEFENEGVGANERFTFETTVAFREA